MIQRKSIWNGTSKRGGRYALFFLISQLSPQPSHAYLDIRRDLIFNTEMDGFNCNAMMDGAMPTLHFGGLQDGFDHGGFDLTELHGGSQIHASDQSHYYGDDSNYDNDVLLSEFAHDNENPLN